MNEIPRSNHAQINDGIPHSAHPSVRSGCLPLYIPPQVISYSNEDILNQISPVHTGSGNPMNGFDPGMPTPP